jgi:hypothetical protein
MEHRGWDAIGYNDSLWGNCAWGSMFLLDLSARFSQCAWVMLWKGRGPLIFIFWFLGAVALGFCAAIVGGFTSKEQAVTWGLAGAVIGGAMGAWIAALTVCKTEHQYWKDAESGIEMLIQKPHSLLGIPAKVWASLFSIVALICMPVIQRFGGMVQVVASNPGSSLSASKLALDQIDAAISTASAPLAQGNHGAAITVGSSFCTALVAATEAAIQAGVATAPKKPIEYRCYVRLTQHELVFLVYAPQYKELGEAGQAAVQRSLASLSVQSANQVLKTPPMQVTVGLKGLLFWEHVYSVGKAGAEAPWSAVSSLATGPAARPKAIVEAALDRALADSSY